jgi:hypothetical protein
MSQTYWETCLKMKFFKDKKINDIKNKIRESNHLIEKFKHIRDVLDEARKS